MKKPILFYTPDSPPCQAVILLIRQLNLDVELRYVDLDKNEHRSNDFRRMNPLHQVPTLDDEGFYLTDSHAIISYLATNSNLISDDRRLQARINQLLFFDFELFKIFCEIGIPLLLSSAPIEPSQRALKILHEKLDALEHYLTERKWVSSEFMTIADISVLATFSAIYHCPIDLTKYEETLKWFERCKDALIAYSSIEEDSKNALGKYLKRKGVKL